MSFVSAIRAHIPYLRRYARILTGSQQSGDAHVRACLEAAVEGNEELGKDLPPQVALFQLFHACWSPELDTSDVDGDASPLSHVTPKARQVMLLTSVEGFSIEDVAKILRIDDTEAQSLLVSAQQELNAGLATRVMIIEDEPVIALDLRAIVENAGHTVTGVARTRDQAVALAQKSPPGLVLADIQLADDSSGIDAVKDILDEMNVPVIFITAYPERLLTGEKPEPTYLVTKPFMPETVSATISQALFFFERKPVAAE
ncbi:response regulator [Oceanicaulis sp. LC35]|uniref:response regulator n=1 Tax=Oceanicaulis sp. LC35 TaxID=3349635 RepID=UPI003F851CC7